MDTKNSSENNGEINFTVNLDKNGHSLRGILDSVNTIDLRTMDMGDEGKELGHPVFLPRELLISCCENCGEYLDFEGFEERFFKVLPTELKITTKCDFTERGPLEVELNFPSGKVIVSDVLFPQFETDLSEISLNYPLGRVQITKDMAEVNCAHAVVGNSNPGIYIDLSGNLFVATTYGHTGITIEDYKNYENSLIPSDWCEVARIETNVWAYSIADYQEWLDKGGNSIEDTENNYNQMVVSIKPGKYKLISYVNESSFKGDEGLVIYGKLELHSE